MVNEPEREVDHSPSSNAQDRNEWSHTSTTPIRLHGVHSETFTLYIYSFIDAVDVSGTVVSTARVVSK